MQVKISQIQINGRVRKEMRNIESLAQSIKEIGQLQPIGIDSNYNLLFGERRIQALSHLGQDSVKAEIHSSLNTALLSLQAETHENSEREPFLPTEAVAAAEKLRDLVAEEARERQGTRTDLEHCGNLPQSKTGKTRDKVGDAVGMSGRTYEKARQVIEAAEESPEEYGDLPDLMDSKSVDAAHKKLKKKKRVKQVQKQADEIEESGVAIPERLYSVISVDPPWPYGTEYDPGGRRAANPYPEQSLEEIRGMPIPAAKDCILWLWTTHKFMRHAFPLLDAWGFEDKAILTWVKDRMGLGSWLRSQSEFCIMAVKGSPVIDLSNQTTVIHGPLREHSRKPEEFYALVESLCPGLKLDYYSRSEREGWDQVGNDKKKFINELAG